VIENGVVYKKSKRPGGRWSPDEHKRFIDALRIYGKDWQQIEDAVKTRTSA
jgi:SHAQKYF class myb-like DNA-binding protein